MTRNKLRSKTVIFSRVVAKLLSPNVSALSVGFMVFELSAFYRLSTITMNNIAKASRIIQFMK